MIFISKCFTSSNDVSKYCNEISKCVRDYFKLATRYDFDNRMLLLYEVNSDQTVTLRSNNIAEFSTYILNNTGLYQIRTIDIPDKTRYFNDI